MTNTQNDLAVCVAVSRLLQKMQNIFASFSSAFVDFVSGNTVTMTQSALALISCRFYAAAECAEGLC